MGNVRIVFNNSYCQLLAIASLMVHSEITLCTLLAISFLMAHSETTAVLRLN